MPIPKFDELLLPVLQQMQKGSYKRTEVFSALKDTIQKQWKLTEGEMNETVSHGGSRIKDRTDWAMTFLTKAEYITKDSSRKMSYIVTELGKQTLEDCIKNNIPLTVKYLEENSPNYLENWNVKSVSKNEIITDDEKSEDIDIEAVAQEMREQVEEDLREKLQSMDWKDFEDFCQELMKKMGYGVPTKRGKRVGDGGIDGIIIAGDELNIREKYIIQAKRYQACNAVSAKDIREFRTVISDHQAKGVFITTSTFSPDAKSAAQVDEAKGNISLVDINRLIKLCFHYKHGVAATRTVDLFEVVI
jgi:restriction system protein